MTGTSTITATLGGVTGSTVLTVSPAVLQSIAVTPANPSVPEGRTEQFTATGTFSDNSTEDLTSQVTWASATTVRGHDHRRRCWRPGWRRARPRSAPRSAASPARRC